jgi:hypothetical protein
VKERIMQEFSYGDNVEWNFTQGKLRGRVVKKLTTDMQIGNHMIHASHDDPQYLVCSDYGNLAAHKPGTLKKLR